MKRMGLAGVALAIFFCTIAGGASASTLCLQLKANGVVKGPTTVGGSTCKLGYEKIELPPAAELGTLNKVLPHVKYEESGVGGKPTIQFSAVNVQVVSGAGKTNAAVNGEGNLVIGYDEDKEAKHAQTGSHDLILGEEQTFTTYGGVVAGFENTISGPFAAVGGGEHNVASGEHSSVGGGNENTANGTHGATVSGGWHNTASGSSAAVSGGQHNTASGGNSAVSGGGENLAQSSTASISGGIANFVKTGSVEEFFEGWIGGGKGNVVAASYASVFGGKELKATKEFEAIP